jgi:hypothetical protein
MALMKNYISLILIITLLSCESELTKLKKERETLQIELNELRDIKKYPIRYYEEAEELRKMQEPILKRAEEINRRIKELEN